MFLHPSYPENLLQNIFLGKEIYDGHGKVIVDDGFIQKINTKDARIVYKVKKDSVFFKDIKNKIIFKIKDTK